MRGWSQINLKNSKRWVICPAYAGMILKFFFNLLCCSYLSRVCGDDPRDMATWLGVSEFVPRMRGWSSTVRPLPTLKHICPAYAGMILIVAWPFLYFVHLSRVCGDDPAYQRGQKALCGFVPRMRGWSYLERLPKSKKLICPAYAGMILNFPI